MDIVGKYFAVVLVIIGIFIAPAVITANLHDEVTQERVEGIVNKFTSEVREQGKITKGMYEAYIRELDATGNIYNVEMVYSKVVIIPSSIAGEVTRTEESFYTRDIVAGIYRKAEDGGDIIDNDADGEVHFTAGGYFSVRVTNKNDTLYQSIVGLLPFYFASSPRIEVHNGGEIRDENW